MSLDPEQHSVNGNPAINKRNSFAIIAFCITILANGGYSAEGTTQPERSIASDQAAIISTYFVSIRNQLTELARDAELIQLFTAGDAINLGQEATRRTDQFASTLKLRLLIPGQYEVDNTTHPPLGFTSLELLRRAEVTTETINPEALMLGSDNAHIVFIERVNDGTGALIGLIHLSLGADHFDRAIATLAVPSAYLELQQTIGEHLQVLATKGKPEYRQGEPLQASIAGTGWSLAYWVDGGAASIIENEGGSAITTAIVIALILLLAVAAGVIYLRRGRTRTAVAPADDGTMTGEGVVYTGALRAILEGAHPGMEKLIPNLASMNFWEGNIRPISQGMSGNDITMVASAKEMKVAAGGDFFDLTGGGDTSTGETITEPKTGKPAKPPAAQSQPEKPEISPTIFRTYDIRGVVGKDLTPESVQKIGQAIGSEAAARKEKKIAVGRDGRLSSPELAAALIAGLRAAGRDVIDIGLVPTPVLYFATHTLDTRSGVMLTGSHNGPDYNGLKIVLAGETLSQDSIQGIYHRIMEDNLESGQGSLDTREITTDYIRRITEDIPVALGGAFKLVVDCGNGVAGILAPQLYRALGHDVIELFCEVDGKFPNHHPDPSQPENLQTLIDKVKTEQADLGFAFDGDGDRLGVVDGDGNIIWPDRQLMILAQDVLSRNPGAPIIYDVKCSRHLKAVITAGGGQPLMWKTGHSLIKNKMKEVNAPLAGEMSGHIFFKERWYGFDDALYTGARLLEVLMRTKGKPATTFAKIPNAVATPELRVDLPESAHQSFMGELQDRIAFADAEVFAVDGFRVEFHDGWGLVRPSNTTPCLILRFEADTQEALSRIKSQFHDLLLSVNPDLKLPF